MTYDLESNSYDLNKITLPVGEKVIDAISPLEQLDRLRRLTAEYPSYLQAPIDYGLAEDVLKDIDEKNLGGGRLLTLFVEHRTKETTEAFNWRMLKNGHPFSSESGEGIPGQGQWSPTAWEEPFRYTPGLHILELKFYDAAGKSIVELKKEHSRLAGVEALSAVTLQKDQFSRFNMGNIVVGGMRKSTGESTEIVPILKIDDHRHHEVDAIFSDSIIGKGYVPVVTATCPLQKFQW